MKPKNHVSGFLPQNQHGARVKYFHLTLRDSSRVVRPNGFNPAATQSPGYRVPFYWAWIVCLRITLHALAYINRLRINPTATRLKISAARSGRFWRFVKAVCAALLSVPGVAGGALPPLYARWRSAPHSQPDQISTKHRSLHVVV